MTCLSESELLLSGAGAEYLLEEVQACSSHYYGADQRLRALVDALNISGLAEESYHEFRIKKGQKLCPLPRRMSLWVGKEGSNRQEVGVLRDGTVVER